MLAGGTLQFNTAIRWLQQQWGEFASVSRATGQLDAYPGVELSAIVVDMAHSSSHRIVFLMEHYPTSNKGVIILSTAERASFFRQIFLGHWETCTPATTYLADQPF